MKNSFTKIIASPVLVLLDQAIFSGSNFLITLFLAQQLELSSFGLFSSITVVTFLLLSTSNAIVIQPFQVSFATIENKKQYFTFLAFMQVLVLLLVFVVILGAALVVNNTSFASVSVVSSSVYVLGYVFQDFYRKLFLGTGNSKIIVLIDLCFVVLVGFGMYYFKGALTLNLSLAIIGLANVISAFPGVWFSIKNYEYPKAFKEFFALHFSQGKWLVFVSGLQWCSSNFFVLLSGAYLGIEALGALRLVQSVFGVINVVLQTVENYFLPKVASLYHQSILEAKKYLVQITFFGLVVLGTLLSILFVFSKEIMLLIGGEKYLEYDYVIKVMAILYVFIFFSYPFRIIVRVLVLNKVFFMGYVLSFIGSICTFHFLLQNYALNGAVIGLILNQILMMGYWYTQLNKKQIVLWK